MGSAALAPIRDGESIGSGDPPELAAPRGDIRA